MRYNLEKKDEGRPEKPAQNEQVKGATAEKIAKETGVSPATIRRDADYAKAVESMDPELRAKVLAGKSGLSKRQVMAWPKISEEETLNSLPQFSIIPS
jgi:hypothetical protein